MLAHEEPEVHGYMSDRGGVGSRVVFYGQAGGAEVGRKEQIVRYFRKVDSVLGGVIKDDRGPVLPGSSTCSLFTAGPATFLTCYGGGQGSPKELTPDELHGIPDPVDRRNKDSYHLVSWKGPKLLVIALEVDLPVYAVEWADDVIDAFPKRHVVLVTHRWLREDGTRWDRTYYRTDTDLLTPEETWERLVRPNCRVFMVLVSHEDTETRRTDRNRCGRRVFQLLANYQDRPNGGDGWLRYYTFRPGNDRIAAFTYSVTRRDGIGEMERDEDSRFTLRWRHRPLR
jgi:hypothetical protein